jgi:hypothetical protein
MTDSNQIRSGKLADDLLVGAKAIADELGIEERQAFHGLTRGNIPARKMGRLWVASRSRLRAHFTGADAA